MKIHRSNRTERLVDALAELLSDKALDPMTKEIIAVQGRGMERWLTLQLAQKLGVAANLHFPFPRAAIEDVLTATLGEEEGRAAARYRPESIVFDLLDLLPDFLSDPRFEDLRRYLEDAPLEKGKPITPRAHALSARIADIFDRYFTYRPEMILRWREGKEEGEEVGWQPVLFRALRERIGKPSFPEIVSEARKKLSDWQAKIDGLPKRISFFGLSTLPPLYVGLLGALRDHCTVHLFLLCPTDQYWADVMNERETSRALARSAFRKSKKELAISEAHPLLGAFGKVGREFQWVLEAGLEGYEPVELFEKPAAKNLLTALQAEVFENPAASPGPHPATSTRGPHPPAPSPASGEGEPGTQFLASLRTSPPTPSPSIQIHSCHGPTRQIEALRDALVRLFDEMPDLEPRDVIVMAPNIDELAPIIEAVFSDGDPNGQKRAGFPELPYRIADRPALHDNPVAEALVALLDLARSRMRAPEVLAFLGREPVRRKFGFDLPSLGTLRRWLDETGIRWGENAAHREAHGIDIGAEQSFEDGLDRLLLGHAMQGQGRRLFAGKLAYDDASDTELLGSFVEASSSLFAVVRGFREKATIRQFAKLVGDAMERLFDMPAGERWQAQAVRHALSSLVEAQPELSETLEFSPEALARLVEVPLRGASSHSFASGMITFCAMVPMRSVPFRVVCLLGMDDGAFPRRTTREGFDLTASSPQRGDRRLEDDDRYLVLEALLSARDKFLVFYSGRDIGDNKKLTPAAPVTELLEAMAKTMKIEGEVSESERRARAERQYLVEHPLQPFGPDAFKRREGRIQTRAYDKRRLDAARALVGNPSPPDRFVKARLPEYSVSNLSVDELARFFADPVRAFFERRLGVRFRDEEEEIDDRERLELGSLENWQIHDAALSLLRERIEPEKIATILNARSILPFGVAGSVKAREAIRAVSQWQPTIDSLQEGGRCEPVHIAIQVDDELSVTGRLRDIYAKGRLRMTWSSQKAHRRIEEWVRHIVYCAMAGEAALPSVLVEKGEKNAAQSIVWEPTPHARKTLETLIALWKEGMRAPLLFFPEPARAYSSELLNTKTPEEEREAKALQRAWEAWSKEDWSGREPPCTKPHNARLFADIGPELFTNEFEWPGDYRFPRLVQEIWDAANEGAE